MIRILVVDDVKLFRHMEATVLGWRGYTIEEAASGGEALDKIRANPPDLVLLDFYMPGMNGHEVCTQIKSDPALHGLPVIMVTSSNRDEDIRAAVQAGCDDYLTKPLDDASLIRKVEDILGSTTKRRYPRVSASMQVSFENFKGIFFEYARDISRTGVFVEMTEPLPVGTQLRLSFSLPPPFNHPVLAYGRVVRSNEAGPDRPGGVGISFIHVDEESAGVIDALVARQEAPEDGSAGLFSRLTFQLDESGEDPSTRPDPRIETLKAESTDLRETVEVVQKDHLRLSAMLSISEGLISATTPSQVVEASADVIRNLLGASAFCIFIHDPGRQLLVPVAGDGLPSHLRSTMPLDGPILGALQDDRIHTPSPPWPLDEDGTVVLATCGIPIEGQMLGVLTIHALFEQKSKLTAVDLQLLEMLSRHLGMGLSSSVARGLAGQIDVKAILKALS